MVPLETKTSFVIGGRVIAQLCLVLKVSVKEELREIGEFFKLSSTVTIKGL